MPCHRPAPCRDGSFLEVELSTPSGASWRAAESGCVLGLLDPLTGAGTPASGGAGGAGLMQLVVGGDGSALAQAPEVSCCAVTPGLFDAVCFVLSTHGSQGVVMSA